MRINSEALHEGKVVKRAVRCLHTTEVASNGANSDRGICMYYGIYTLDPQGQAGICESRSSAEWSQVIISIHAHEYKKIMPK
jgi:hypothetical protein